MYVHTSRPGIEVLDFGSKYAKLSFALVDAFGLLYNTRSNSYACKAHAHQTPKMPQHHFVVAIGPFIAPNSKHLHNYARRNRSCMKNLCPGTHTTMPMFVLYISGADFEVTA